MAKRIVTETFFRPPEFKRVDWTLTSDIYNRCQLLRSRNDANCAFIPIRSMQFLAVADAEEIIFVDSQDYAYGGGEGGRLILLAWQPRAKAQRTSLQESLDCTVIHYRQGLDDVQLRLIGEISRALDVLEQRYRDANISSAGAKIVPLNPAD